MGDDTVSRAQPLSEQMRHPCRRGEGRSSRRLRGTGGSELDAAIVHQDPEAAMREIRRLRTAQEARPPIRFSSALGACLRCWPCTCLKTWQKTHNFWFVQSFATSPAVCS